MTELLIDENCDDTPEPKAEKLEFTQATMLPSAMNKPARLPRELQGTPPST